MNNQDVADLNENFQANVSQLAYVLKHWHIYVQSFTFFRNT